MFSRECLLFFPSQAHVTKSICFLCQMSKKVIYNYTVTVKYNGHCFLGALTYAIALYNLQSLIHMQRAYLISIY